MRESIIAVHRRLLLQWRKAMDLIGPGNMDVHFQDSIGAVSNIHLSGSWIDLGSGAGFPGIALAAYHPDIKVLLVESRQKRALFLKRVISEANIPNITLYHGRTEHLTEQFDGVISRAYKPPLEYLKDADTLCKSNGSIICLLGEHSNFILPNSWFLEEEYLYPVMNGRRKRWLLSRQPSD